MRCFLLAAACVLTLSAQDPAATESASATRGMPARATPADYQAHATVGDFTIGAEFFQHTVPTPKGILGSEDYVVVEAGIFGPAGSKIKLSFEDFSLRINGKKNALPSEPYALIFKSLKDPEWEPEEKVAKPESKTGISTGGGGKGGGGGEPPPVIHVPIKTQREWNQRVEKEAFPEGDRPLPQAGLLFFVYRGKASGIHSLELIYSGAAGKVSLTLQP
jgi:hypothetical protein